MKASALEPSVKELYEQDFFEWTVRNAELIRSGHLAEADVEHLAEEIEDMGKSEQHQLESRVSVLLSHLLKWSVQPNLRSASWRATVDVQRADLEHLLKKMPSLRRRLRDELAELYPLAVKRAIAETGLTQRAFPPSCPFLLDQILDPEFLPE